MSTISQELLSQKLAYRRDEHHTSVSIATMNQSEQKRRRSLKKRLRGLRSKGQAIHRLCEVDFEMRIFDPATGVSQHYQWGGAQSNQSDSCVEVSSSPSRRDKPIDVPQPDIPSATLWQRRQSEVITVSSPLLAPARDLPSVRLTGTPTSSNTYDSPAPSQHGASSPGNGVAPSKAQGNQLSQPVPSLPPIASFPEVPSVPPFPPLSSFPPLPPFPVHPPLPLVTFPYSLEYPFMPSYMPWENPASLSYASQADEPLTWSLHPSIEGQLPLFPLLPGGW